MGIIGKRVIAAALWVCAVAVGCASDSGVDDALPDYLWYRAQSAQAVEAQGLPPVVVQGTRVDGSEVLADIRTRPESDEKNAALNFVLTVPAGKITSASLTVQSTKDDEGTSAALTKNQREQTVSVKDLGFVRGNRIIRVQLPSVIPGTAGAKLDGGHLRINYDGPLVINTDAKTSNSQVDSPIRNILTKLVANPADIARFAVPLNEVPEPANVISGPPVGGYPDAVARFRLSEAGLFKFSGADLAACGVNLDDIAGTSVTVWASGRALPMMGSALFDGPRAVNPEDDFLVYAADIGNTYTLTTDCWVRLNAEGGQYMNVAFGGANSIPEPGSAPKHFMATRIVEQDSPPVLTKNDQFLTILGYRWVWWTWTAAPHGEVPNPRDYNTSGSVTFDLDGLSTQSDKARLNLSFYAHHWTTTSQPVAFNVSLNGKGLGRVIVSEPSALDHLIEVNSNRLRRTTNTLVITPDTTETKNLPDLCFDKLEVTYPRDYVLTSDTLEFTAPESGAAPIGLTWDAPTTSVSVLDITTTIPKFLTTNGDYHNVTNLATEPNRRYLAVDTNAISHAKLRRAQHLKDLRSADNQADLIVIAWPGFITDMLPWVEHKKSLGHTVQVVDVFSIYDQFGYGNASPHAIREFIRYAAIHWQGSEKGAAASTIMLVGDSTSAYRNEFRNNVINYVPTMRRTDVGDPFASDQWFVSIFGNDPFADALIGRFSINNNKDLRSIIRKQLDYETRSASGPWQNTLGFIADDSGFEESVERVMTRTVPPRFFLDKIFMSQLPWIDNYYFPKAVADAREAKVSPEATDRIREMFDRGAAVVTYFGHGSPNIWSTERMWFGGDSPNSDNLLLTNKDKLAVVINMTCNSGAIDYPQPRWNVCISEDFMRVPNGGAVACFVPSGPGLTLQHERLMTEISPTLFGNQNHSLGESFQLALWRYLAKDNPRELAEMFILLGDPLLVPHIAEPMPVGSTDAASSASNIYVLNPDSAQLPPDMTGGEGNFQFYSYESEVKPGKIGTFTTGTRVVPLPAVNTNEIALAVSNTASTSNVNSTLAPVANPGGLRVLQWSQDNQSTGSVVLQFQLQNDTPLPIRAAIIRITDVLGRNVLAQSDPVNFSPFTGLTLTVNVPCEPGLTPVRAWLTDGFRQKEMETDVPLAIACVRTDDSQTSIPPVIIDPRTIKTHYRTSGAGIAASISFRAYTLAQEPLSNLQVGLAGPDGTMIGSSVVSVPSASPGRGVNISTSVDFPTTTSAASYYIRFDPTGLYPELTRFPEAKVTLGSDQYPDVVIESIIPSDANPTDGETVFLDVIIGNRGLSPVEGVRTMAFTLASDGTRQPAKSQIFQEPASTRLEPGTTQSFRLRWDPFQNAGDTTLLVTAHSAYTTPDINPADNEKTIRIRARTKAQLRNVGVGVLKLTANDMANRQVRFSAKVRNDGETAAHGLKVSFYSEKSMAPETFLGDVEIPVLEPGKTEQAILTYKLKQGEEDKPFRITCEVMYKGSRQRIPLKE